MSFQTSFNTMRSRWRTKIAQPQNLLTGYDNDLAFTTPETGRWARVTLRMASSELMELGSTKRTRHIGIMFVQLFDDIGRGDKALLILADAISADFQSITVDAITWRTPTVEHIGQSSKWYQVNVLCPFEFDDFTVGTA